MKISTVDDLYLVRIWSNDMMAGQLNIIMNIKAIFRHPRGSPETNVYIWPSGLQLHSSGERQLDPYTSVSTLAWSDSYLYHHCSSVLHLWNGR